MDFWGKSTRGLNEPDPDSNPDAVLPTVCPIDPTATGASDAPLVVDPTAEVGPHPAITSDDRPNFL